ncbi:MAG: serine hydrolase domain-containing protein, partial [Longimicrobiales bacterium]
MRGALLLAALHYAAPVAAQQATITRAAPRDADMSPAVLEAGVGLYREAVERGDLVGAVLLVARNGKVVLHEAVGSRNREANLPMEKNTMFRMASNTKPVIATAVAMLVERSKLKFEDPVRKYIPTFDNYKSGFIQIEHLLSHTSGLRIPTLFLQPYLTRSAQHPDAPTLKLEAARFGEVGAEVTPGTSYSYSNPGYNTLGALIEIGSGQPLETFLRNEIYKPLGMVDTYNHEIANKLDGKLERMGAVYYTRKDGQWSAGWKPGDAPQVPFPRASGGLISTAWDYAIFLQAFLNGGVYGDVRLLKPETVKLMTSRHTPETAADAGGYGYGWRVESDGVYSHGGSDGTFAWVDPS